MNNKCINISVYSSSSHGGKSWLTDVYPWHFDQPFMQINPSFAMVHQCVQALGYALNDFPEAERLAGQSLSLPMFPELSEDQIQGVAGAVKGFFAVGKKSGMELR
jgi:hypothetical protein